MQQKKTCLEKSNERADQIAWRNDDNTLGILKVNLELKRLLINMFIIKRKEGGRKVPPSALPHHFVEQKFFKRNFKWVKQCNSMWRESDVRLYLLNKS